MVYAVSAGQLWLPTEPLTVLVELCDLAKVKANKFNSLRQTAL